MKKLPIGIQNIEEVIKENIYVDKTEVVYRLISEGKYYFLSRPRRFGKSLLISTLEQIFKGNKELFKGLYIYDKIEWKQYPVIRLDLSGVNNRVSEEKIIKNIIVKLDIVASDYKIILTQDDLSNRFEELIIALSKKGQVVILIDEYDKPIIDNLTDDKKANENREVLRQLFSPLKGLDERIKFAFLTGVSKFSKVSIFSGLNNLNDITLHPKYNVICGLTQSEVEDNFSEYIEVLAKEDNESIENTKNKMKDWYNGYSWDGKIKVYNPFSLLKLFNSNVYDNYWFETATPTFLVELFKEEQYDLIELEDVESDNIGLSATEIGNVDLIALLFQTGYLTIKETRREETGSVYSLSYPNHEVKDSLIKYLFAGYTNVKINRVKKTYRELIDSLNKLDVKGFETSIQGIFSGVPYNVQGGLSEYSYQTYFYLILTLIGANIDLEVLTDKGRIDAVLELNEKIFIIEFKLDSEQEAINQIKERKYFERYLNQDKEIYLLGVGGFEKKEIKCLIEKV